MVVADKSDRTKTYNSRFISNPVASAKLKSTLTLTRVRDKKYGAVFIIGGKGAMFDLPVSVDLKTLLARTYDAGGVVGAVCHGLAALKDLVVGKVAAGPSERMLDGLKQLRRASYARLSPHNSRLFSHYSEPMVSSRSRAEAESPPRPVGS